MMPGLIPPVMCDQCGDNAPLIQRTPDPHNPGVELRSFKCSCGQTMRRNVNLGVSDRDIESLAKRIVGRAEL